MAGVYKETGRSTLFSSLSPTLLERVICIYSLCFRHCPLKSGFISHNPSHNTYVNSEMFTLIARWNSFSWILSSLIFLMNLIELLTTFWKIFPQFWSYWSIVFLPTLTDLLSPSLPSLVPQIKHGCVPKSVLNSVSLPFLYLLSGDLYYSHCFN